MRCQEDANVRTFVYSGRCWGRTPGLSSFGYEYRESSGLLSYFKQEACVLEYLWRPSREASGHHQHVMVGRESSS